MAGLVPAIPMRSLKALFGSEITGTSPVMTIGSRYMVGMETAAAIAYDCPEVRSGHER
jgi:hypothetical protein